MNATTQFGKDRSKIAGPPDLLLRCNIRHIGADREMGAVIHDALAYRWYWYWVRRAGLFGGAAF
jgi:hypothetical protein